MNCLELRRIRLCDPQAESAELCAHLDTCPACRAFVATLATEDALLQQALAVPVPLHLAERVLLTAQLQQRRWQPWALAASLVLALSVGMGAWQMRPQPTPSWSEVVLAHVLNERATLAHRDEVSPRQFASALADYGLDLKGNLGRVSYLDHCDMPGGKGLHVVLETADQGRVTLILPPLSAGGAARGEAARAGFAARMLTVGATAIGIVTERPEQLDRLGQLLGQQLAARRLG